MRLHQELVLGVGGVRALRALGLDPGGLAPQRGPLRVPARGAGPRAGRRRHPPWTTAWTRSAATACSRSTRRSRPATSGSTRTSCAASPGRCSRATGGPETGGDPARRGPRAGPRRRPRPVAVRHDRVLAAPDHRRQRRLAAPRPHGQRHLAGRDAARHPRPDQRRPHARPGSASRCATRWSATRTRTSTAWTTSPPRAGSGSACDKVPTAELWEAHQRQKLELAIFARGRLRNQFARHGEAPVDARGAGGGPRPVDPHDRLRAPVRHLQARRAAVLGPRPARPPPVGRGSADADHLRRQGPPGRPARPGRDPGHLRPVAQPQAPRSRVHPRGLRHPDRAVPGAGRGRLAQQPAPPAGGVRARRA